MLIHVMKLTKKKKIEMQHNPILNKRSWFKSVEGRCEGKYK